MEAIMNEDQKPPFYDESAKAPDSITPGPIADTNTAHDIASVEAAQGRNAALAREQELKLQHETGHTDEQRARLEVMDGLKQMFPDALKEYTDDRGRKVLIVLNQSRERNPNESWYPTIILSEVGNYQISTFGTNLQKLNLNTIIQELSENGKRLVQTYDEIDIKKVNFHAHQATYVLARRFDIVKDASLLSVHLRKEQEYQADKKAQVAQQLADEAPQTILEKFRLP
jgi:hypothetical protein